MQQGASTSAALFFDDLASTSSEVHPGLLDVSTAVFCGEVASTKNAVQAGKVASNSSKMHPLPSSTEFKHRPVKPIVASQRCLKTPN